LNTGRGASTYDGVSIAWAVAEYLHDQLGPRALFATHYHELCGLADLHPRVRNVSVAAREWKGDVVFLRKLTPGGASRSFGIEVAKIAGVPALVLARARAILASLEADRATPGGPHQIVPGKGEAPQLGLFEGSPAASVPAQSDVLALSDMAETLRQLQMDDLSPREAWTLLEGWQARLRGPSGGPPASAKKLTS
jgi:DNA mismatch repair protein MutS